MAPARPVAGSPPSPALPAPSPLRVKGCDEGISSRSPWAQSPHASYGQPVSGAKELPRTFHVDGIDMHGVVSSIRKPAAAAGGGARSASAKRCSSGFNFGRPPSGSRPSTMIDSTYCGRWRARASAAPLASNSTLRPAGAASRTGSGGSVDDDGTCARAGDTISSAHSAMAARMRGAVGFPSAGTFVTIKSRSRRARDRRPHAAPRFDIAPQRMVVARNATRDHLAGQRRRRGRCE